MAESYEQNLKVNGGLVLEPVLPPDQSLDTAEAHHALEKKQLRPAGKPPIVRL